jgi:nucleoside-diphosphate-sugar epimerase
MKALITGILGFIGSNLAEKLVSDGNEVYGLVRRVANRNLGVLGETIKDVTLVSGDITDYASTRNALKISNPDVVFHLAALSPVRDSFERPFEYQQANFTGTMNVAHSLLELPDSQKRKLIAASTAEVYGIQENKPLKESLALKPSSPYAVTKAAADLYLQMMFNSFDLHGTVMRPTNSYGRKFEKNFMVEYLVTLMLKSESLYIGAPDSVRDYMYVDDHVNAYILAAKKPEADGQVYNVGTGIGITNRQLAELIADKIEYDVKKIKFGSYPPGYPLRPLSSDQPYLVLDAMKVKKDLHWSPKCSLSEGLEKVIAYFRNSGSMTIKQ